MLADKARNSIAKYCMEECQAHCCRAGHLILKGKEVNKVTQKHSKELISTNLLKKLNTGEYTLTLKNGCPSLSCNKCTIHNSKNRPQACRDFPIIIKDNIAMFSERCPAVREGLLYGYEAKMIKKGYKVIRGLDIDFID